MKKKMLLVLGVLLVGTQVVASDLPKSSGEQDKIDNDQIVEVGTASKNSTVKELLDGRQKGEEAQFTGTYFGELRLRNFQGPGRSNKESNGNYSNSVNKMEWTVAEGKLNFGNFGFSYSADRDFNYDKKWNKQSEGWDTSFSINYKMGMFYMLDKEWDFNPTINYQYDTKENFTSKAADPSEGNHETKRRLSLIPKVSTTYIGFATDISPILSYDDIRGTVSLQLDISNYRQLSDNWETYGDVYFDFAGTKDDKSDRGNDTYSNSIFSGNIDEDNKFALSIEQYLSYTKQISGNFYFKNELGLEAYSILQSDANDIALYTAPQLQYRGKVGDWTVVPYVKYIAYTASGGYEDSYARDEFSLGVRFGTSF